MKIGAIPSNAKPDWILYFSVIKKGDEKSPVKLTKTTVKDFALDTGYVGRYTGIGKLMICDDKGQTYEISTDNYLVVEDVQNHLDVILKGNDCMIKETTGCKHLDCSPIATECKHLAIQRDRNYMVAISYCSLIGQDPDKDFEGNCNAYECPLNSTITGTVATKYCQPIDNDNT